MFVWSHMPGTQLDNIFILNMKITDSFIKFCHFYDEKSIELNHIKIKFIY